MVESLTTLPDMYKHLEEVIKASKEVTTQLNGTVSLLGHYGQCLLKNESYDGFKKCVIKN